jgi:two-component system LytT family response regulator
MSSKIRVVVADDERPARQFLLSMLNSFEDVKVVGEATNGTEALEIIEQTQPDLALLDLQMPELDGLGVVRALKKNQMPLIAFVTAYDEYAVRAFEINAVDYLLKPVDRVRLRETINRAQERLDRAELRLEESANLEEAIKDYESANENIAESTSETSTQQTKIDRIPIRQKDEIIILPVNKITSIIADGELLNITSTSNETYNINYRLKDLEVRLDPSKFVRLGRGALVNIDMISKINQMPGGTYLVTLTNNQQIKVSRLQSRFLREKLLRL